jgi:hypothetical protein
MMDTLPIIISFGALALNAASMFIGFGVLKNTVKTIDDRVKSLEVEIKAITDIKISVAEIKVGVAYMTRRIDDLPLAIRPASNPRPRAVK